MLDGEGGNPYVVGWNGISLRAQLMKQAGVMVRSLLVGIEDTRARTVQKLRQHPLVASSVCATMKTGTQFGQTDKRKTHPVRALQGINNLGPPPTEITVPIGIEQQIHFHSSGSTLLMS